MSETKPKMQHPFLTTEKSNNFLSKYHLKLNSTSVLTINAFLNSLIYKLVQFEGEKFTLTVKYLELKLAQLSSFDSNIRTLIKISLPKVSSKPKKDLNHALNQRSTKTFSIFNLFRHSKVTDVDVYDTRTSGMGEVDNNLTFTKYQLGTLLPSYIMFYCDTCNYYQSLNVQQTIRGLLKSLNLNEPKDVSPFKFLGSFIANLARNILVEVFKAQDDKPLNNKILEAHLDIVTFVLEELPIKLSKKSKSEPKVESQDISFQSSSSGHDSSFNSDVSSRMQSFSPNYLSKSSAMDQLTVIQSQFGLTNAALLLMNQFLDKIVLSVATKLNLNIKLSSAHIDSALNLTLKSSNVLTNLYGQMNRSFKAFKTAPVRPLVSDLQSKPKPTPMSLVNWQQQFRLIVMYFDPNSDNYQSRKISNFFKNLPPCLDLETSRYLACAIHYLGRTLLTFANQHLRHYNRKTKMNCQILSTHTLVPLLQELLTLNANLAETLNLNNFTHKDPEFSKLTELYPPNPQQLLDNQNDKCEIEADQVSLSFSTSIETSRDSSFSASHNPDLTKKDTSARSMYQLQLGNCKASIKSFTTLSAQPRPSNEDGFKGKGKLLEVDEFDALIKSNTTMKLTLTPAYLDHDRL